MPFEFNSNSAECTAEKIFAGDGKGLRKAVLVSYIVDWPWLAQQLHDAAAATTTVNQNGDDAAAPLRSLPTTTVCVNWLPESEQSEDPLPIAFGEGDSTLSVPSNWLHGLHGKEAPHPNSTSSAAEQEEAEEDEEKEKAAPSWNWTIHHAPLGDDERALMHCKLMLLTFESFIRVVVTSANLTRDDWEVLGQNVWWFDAPKQVVAKNTDESSDPAFKRDLLFTLRHLRFTEEAINSMCLNDFDFSRTDCRLVLSVPKSLAQVPSPSTSEGAVPRAVPPAVRLQKLIEGMKEGKTSDAVRPDGCSGAPLFYLSSAVGGVSDVMLHELCHLWTSASAAAKPPPLIVPVCTEQIVEQQLRLGAVGCITLRYFQSPQSICYRGSFVPFLEAGSTPVFHSKCLFHCCHHCLPPNEASDSPPQQQQLSPSSCHSWALAGSHNLTSDCWGNFKVAQPDSSSSDDEDQHDSSVDELSTPRDQVMQLQKPDHHPDGMWPTNFELSVFLPDAGTTVVPHLPETIAACWRRCTVDPLRCPRGLPPHGPEAAFRIFKYKHQIKMMGMDAEQAAYRQTMTRITAEGDAVGEKLKQEHRQRWFHWLKFLDEFSNDYGRH